MGITRHRTNSYRRFYPLLPCRSVSSTNAFIRGTPITTFMHATVWTQSTRSTSTTWHHVTLAAYQTSIRIKYRNLCGSVCLPSEAPLFLEQTASSTLYTGNPKPKTVNRNILPPLPSINRQFQICKTIHFFHRSKIVQPWPKPRHRAVPTYVFSRLVFVIILCTGLNIGKIFCSVETMSE
jgi:hypothetical protein